MLSVLTTIEKKDISLKKNNCTSNNEYVLSITHFP